MTVTYKHKWNRWAGPVALIADVASLAQNEMSNWTDEEVNSRVVVSWANRKEELDSIELLNGINTFELSKINEIDIDVGSYFRAPSLSLRFTSSYDGLNISIIGNDKTRAKGLYEQMTELLGRHGSRFGGPLKWMSLQFGVVGSILLLLVIEIITGGRLVWRLGLAEQNGQNEPAEILEIFFTVLIAVCIAFFVWWITPTLQLLGPGDKTRFQRFRAAIYVVSVTFFTGLAATVMYELFFKKT